MEVNPDDLVLLEVRVEQPRLVHAPPLASVAASDVVGYVSRGRVCRCRGNLECATVEVAGSRCAVIGGVTVVLHDGVEGADKGAEARQAG